eukprot:10135674-Lingulodinium_polyedra.AAC.1
MSLLERRVQSLEADTAFYLTEFAAYQAKERNGFPQHFNLASDDVAGSGEEYEEEEENEEPED